MYRLSMQLHIIRMTYTYIRCQQNDKFYFNMYVMIAKTIINEINSIYSQVCKTNHVAVSGWSCENCPFWHIQKIPIQLFNEVQLKKEWKCLESFASNLQLLNTYQRITNTMEDCQLSFPPLQIVFTGLVNATSTSIGVVGRHGSCRLQFIKT